VTIRDPDFGMVQVRANGLCVVKIEDPAIFLREIIGTDSAVEAEEISELLRRVITRAFFRQGSGDRARRHRLAGQAGRAVR